MPQLSSKAIRTRQRIRKLIAAQREYYGELPVKHALHMKWDDYVGGMTLAERRRTGFIDRLWIKISFARLYSTNP